MKNIDFTKINGAGNDFILIDKRKNDNIKLSVKLIRKMCDRKKGIGADGVLFIKPSKKYDFELVFYNSDGSLGSLCGNGARCSIKYASDNYNLKTNRATFLFNKETYHGEILTSGDIKFFINRISDIRLNIKINLGSKIISGDFINTGSPHVVINWHDIQNRTRENFNNYSINRIGRTIRFGEEFKPAGTNVNFIKKTKDLMFIRTYERGVEDETLSCGTGAVAAAIIEYLKNQTKPPITFQTKSGDYLKVDFTVDNEKFNKITLTGPVKINYIGCYNF